MQQTIQRLDNEIAQLDKRANMLSDEASAMRVRAQALSQAREWLRNELVRSVDRPMTYAESEDAKCASDEPKIAQTPRHRGYPS